MSAIAGDLQCLFPGIVKTSVPLSRISRWRIGGLADVVVSPRSVEELAKLRMWIHERGLPSVIIGATTNLLFADEGLRAIAIRIGSQFAPFSIDGSKVIAGPGVWVPGFARKAMLAGLTGLEHTAGIPGTLGGLVCMNGGSQRKGIGECVLAVQSVNALGEIIERDQAQCGFAYRTSVFQSSDEVICQTTLQLSEAADKRAVRREMLAILRDRRRKFPQKLPNCGSTFVSNPAMYADYGPPGKVIEDAGFKGYRIGAAVVSPMHANFIVNDITRGKGATSRDVLELINLIRNTVAERTGYEMAVEVRHVSPAGNVQII